MLTVGVILGVVSINLLAVAAGRVFCREENILCIFDLGDVAERITLVGVNYKLLIHPEVVGVAHLQSWGEHPDGIVVGWLILLHTHSQ